jgi:hypothetical protein
MYPKVFLSHASEDKERFVLDFAKKLRANGIDVWLDRWEMYPGDSLVDKIFNEGLKDADAVIVVISNISVSKPWVKEELNASMVKKINDGSKLIPVIIDDCAVPDCLNSTVWEKIKDTANYHSELDHIVMAIYGHKEKPPLGAVPKYATTVIEKLPGLNEIDNIIISISCKKAIEKGDLFISLNEIADQLNSFQIPEEEISDSLEILDNRGYIKARRVFGGSIPFFFITDYGFNKYAQVSIKEYDEIFNSMMYLILNSEMRSNTDFSEKLSTPIVLINHVLNILESKGLIKVVRLFGGSVQIHHISPELKRKLK